MTGCGGEGEGVSDGLLCVCAVKAEFEGKEEQLEQEMMGRRKEKTQLETQFKMNQDQYVSVWGQCCHVNHGHLWS